MYRSASHSDHSSHQTNNQEEEEEEDVIEMDPDDCDLPSDCTVVNPCYNYETLSLAQPLIAVAAALITLVIEKNISATVLDSIMTLLMVSGV